MEDNRITIPIKTSVVQFFKQTLKAFFISAVIPYVFYALISFFTAELDYKENYGSSYYSSSGFYAKTENTKEWYLKDAFGGKVYTGSWYSSTSDSIRFEDRLDLLKEVDFIFAWFITFLIVFGTWMLIIIVKALRKNFRIELTGNENSLNKERYSQNSGYTGGYNGGHNQQNTGNSSHSQNEEYQQGSMYN
ncbi:hypothetical protein ACIRNY_11775 [Capnocytophaga canimorsus]|uniref:hypothetical protein n=1 Tax=Capnocytophaga canimorsus TaxID=28188 RepID=UPI00384B838D